MFSQFLIKKLIKDNKIDTKSRELVGRVSSYVGIVLNICLASMKMITGTIFHSVSIFADGVNNLSDAGNSLILLISFKLSSRPADEEHPFGHERTEYLASMVVGVSILVLSFELLKSAVDKIIHPSGIEFSYLMVIVLVVSILGKIWLYYFYRNCGKAIDSLVLQASAQDSRNDVLATITVLASACISYFFHIQLDGWMGIVVAVVILMSGIEIIKEALNKILGEAPSKELVDMIEREIMSYDGVLGIHDLMVHSYGPNRCFVSVHAEVDSKVDVLQSHDLIDNIEQNFLKEKGIHVVIHMDPIVVDDPVIMELKQAIQTCVNELSSDLRIHDFRAVIGQTHTNLIFDCVVPYSCKLSYETIQQHVDEMLKKQGHVYHTVVTFERPYN